MIHLMADPTNWREAPNSLVHGLLFKKQKNSDKLRFFHTRGNPSDDASRLLVVVHSLTSIRKYMGANYISVEFDQLSLHWAKL